MPSVSVLKLSKEKLVRSIHLPPTVDIDCRVAESSHQTLRLGAENIELVGAVVELLLQGVEEEGQVGGCSALSIEINVVAGVLSAQQGILPCTMIKIKDWLHRRVRRVLFNYNRKHSKYRTKITTPY